MKTKYQFLLCAFLLFFSQKAAAQQYPFEPTTYLPNLVNATSLLPNSAGGISNLLLFEHSYFATELNPGNANNVIGHMQAKDIKAYIKVYIDHTDPMIYHEYNYYIKLKVKAYAIPGSTTYTTFNELLQVSYKPEGVHAYQDVHMVTYPGYYKLEVELEDVLDYSCVYDPSPCSPPPFNPTSLPTGFLEFSNQGTALDIANMTKNWKIEIGCNVQKFDNELKVGATWKSVYGINANLNLNVQPPTPTENSITINWGVNAPDEAKPSMYELEWTYIDNYSTSFGSSTAASANLPHYSIKSVSDLNYSFKKDATRIVTDKTTYKIPLIYKRGYLVCRVRIVRPDNGIYKSDVYGPWTISSNEGSLADIQNNYASSLYYIDNTVHLADKYNWNYQVSFAEEGKSKHVVSYFDGLLKNRQSVTKFGSLPGQQIVAETYYNYEGKPGLQTLPIPIAQSKLQFVEFFAFPQVAGGPTTYLPSQFDNKIFTPLLGLASGTSASNYYSSQNSFYTASPAWKYLRNLPKDNGFPLIQTLYDPETGSVSKQGGVGNELQIGSGHETQYYYFQANKTELDKYFGVNIGKAPFYDKIITKDPNSQMSFSIMDNLGKVRMTGLMGYTSNTSPLVLPDGVTLPPTNSAAFLTTNVLEGKLVDWGGTKKIVNHEFLNETAGPPVLNYSLTIPPFLACSTANTTDYLNIPFQYKLDVTDDLGNLTTIANSSAGSIYQGTTQAAGVVSANNTNNSTTVPVGKTNITYTLSYNEADLNAAVDNYVQPIGNGPLYAAQLYSPCLKQEHEFIYDALKEINSECDDKEESDCENYRITLKEQLFPNNKFAKSELKFALDPYSNTIEYLYGVNTSLFSIHGNWGAFGPTLPPALNETQVSQAIGLGTIMVPSYRYQFYLWNLYQQNQNGTVTAENGIQYSYLQLLSMKAPDFAAILDDNIVELLFPMHPEYCRYMKWICDNHTYEKKLSAILSWDIAVDLGLSSLSALCTNDPLGAEAKFTSVGNVNDFKLYRINENGSWVNRRIDQIALTMIFCANDPDCRSLIINMSEAEINSWVNIFPNYLKDAYITKLIELYNSNRNDVVSRKNAQILNVGGGIACNPSPFVIGYYDENPGVDEHIIKALYNNSGDDKPNFINTDLPQPPPGLDVEFSVTNNTIPTTANLSFAEANGFQEYAEQIAKALSNCLNVNKPMLISTLLTYMQNHASDDQWLGGITPTSLSSILTGLNLNTDDLCNPYLVDYQQSLKKLKIDNFSNCNNIGNPFAVEFHAILNTTFFNSIKDAYLNPGTTFSMTNTLQNVSTINSLTPGGFFEPLLKRLYNSSAMNSNINIKATYIAGSETMNIVISSVGISPEKSVLISFKEASGQFFNPSTFTHTVFCTNPPGVGFVTYSNFGQFNCLSSLPGAFNSVSTYESQTFFSIKLQTIGILCLPQIFNEGWQNQTQTDNFYGSIFGLYDKDETELHNCISCLEYKRKFEDFRNKVMYTSAQVAGASGYNIKGYGHPMWENVIRSFFNYEFSKNHSTAEYLKFMESCNLSDYYKIPRYGSYIHVLHTLPSVSPATIPNNTLLTEMVINMFNTYQGGVYKNFNRFYYFDLDASGNVTAAHLLIDIESFPKEEYRNILQAIWAVPAVWSTDYDVKVNFLDNEIAPYGVSPNSNLFATIFVTHDASQANYNFPNPCSPPPLNNTINPQWNWTPDMYLLKDYGGYPNCNVINTYATVTDAPTLVMIGNEKINYKKFTFNQTALLQGNGTQAIQKMAEKQANFSNQMTSSIWRDFRSYPSYATHWNTENAEAAKRSYLEYSYSITSVDHDEIINKLLPEALKDPSTGIVTPTYSTNYPTYPLVSYLSADNGELAGHLVIKTNASVHSGFTDLLNIIGHVKTYSSQASFPMNLTNSLPLYNGLQMRLHYFEDHIYWYNLKDPGTGIPQNIYFKLPDMLSPSDVDDYEILANSVEILPTKGNKNKFKLSIKKIGGSGLTYTVYGKTDFPIVNGSVAKVYENVMLCPEPFSYDSIRTCYEDQLAQAIVDAKHSFAEYRDAMKLTLKRKFKNHIEKHTQETLTMKVPESKYAITLYGYDRANNLIYTVPPAGVNELTTQAQMNSVENYRNHVIGFGPVQPTHEKVSTYYYDSRNLLLEQNTPDGGKTVFYYDQAGRLVFSQNAKQLVQNRVSYTLYDKLNRIVETGQVIKNLTVTNYLNDLINKSYTYTMDDYHSGLALTTRDDITHTFYDTELKDLSLENGMSKQENLRSRVATVANYKFLFSGKKAEKNFSIALHYSYDISGNVKTLTYDMPQLLDLKQQFKRIDYDYDLYSGKVTLVSYNRSFADQFYQRYAYDEDNRILKAETSKDGVLWDRDAEYLYYPHGPLAKLKLGDLRVQGVDYAYTLQGWLKAVNGDTPNPLNDMGGDGLGNPYMEDELRATLYYYKNDYTPIDGRNYNDDPGSNMLTLPDLDISGSPVSLYNGNIAASNIIPGAFPSLYTNYVYDHLNRIKAANYKLPVYSPAGTTLSTFSDPIFSANSIGGANVNDVYKSTYTYDLDGNLKLLERWGLNKLTTPANAGLTDYTGASVYKMDDLAYQYDPTANNNKLVNYTDQMNHGATTNFHNDLQQNTDPTLIRFEYDKIGNLIKDASNDLSGITWNLYGKMTSMFKGTDQLFFAYDPTSNRFSKSFKDYTNYKIGNEYYIREASGNILAIYKHQQGFTLENPIIELMNDVLNEPTATNDINTAFGEMDEFNVSLKQHLDDFKPHILEGIMASKTLGYFATRNQNICALVFEGHPDFVNGYYENRPDMCINLLQSTYRPNLFELAVKEGDVEQRNEYLQMLAELTDLDFMNAVMENLDLRPLIQPSEDLFIANLTQVIENSDPQRVLNALDDAYQQHLSVYNDAVLRILENVQYRNAACEECDFGGVNPYIGQLLAKDGKGPELEEYLNLIPTAPEIVVNEIDYEERVNTIMASDRLEVLNSALSEGDGGDFIGSVLQRIPTMSAQLVLKLLADINVNAYAETPLETVIQYDKFYLAEHHFYGSARLGIKEYWPEEYLYQTDIKFTQQDKDDAFALCEFGYRRPWYSKKLNTMIKSQNVTTPFGYVSDDQMYSQRTLGLKKYELTNHLGNVMTVITDKIQEEKVNPSDPYPTLTNKMASKHATYDYYPFGMLMPHRYEELNVDQCMPITKSVYTKKTIDLLTQALDLPAEVGTLQVTSGTLDLSFVSLTEGQGAVAVNSLDAQSPMAKVTASLNSPGLNKHMKVLTSVKNRNSQPLIVELTQVDPATGELRILDSKSVTFEEEVELNGTTLSTEDLQIQYRTQNTMLGVLFEINNYRYIQVDDVVGSVSYLVCNSDLVGDKNYRFGFNGQEKVNEIAGTGNHNTALFWEYDTRLGRRWNLDPVDQVSISNYAVLANNPILSIDPLGDREYKSIRDFEKRNRGKCWDERGEGDWLKSDRLNNRGTWLSANKFNIQRKDGYKEYQSIAQRTAFYGWYQVNEEERGAETKWAGAAFIIARQMEYLEQANEDFPLELLLGEKQLKQVLDFANEGNKKIFEDVWSRLYDNYQGAPKVGLEAQRWDWVTLYREQFFTVQPVYEKYFKQNPNTISILNSLANSRFINTMTRMPSSLLVRGNVMDPQIRFLHGWNHIVPYYMSISRKYAK